MELTVKERVANGVEWLNENSPNWHNKVDLTKLDMVDTQLCTLGQVFKSRVEGSDYYTNGYDYVCGSLMVHPSRNGFDALVDVSSYEELTKDYKDLQKEWIRVITDICSSHEVNL